MMNDVVVYGAALQELIEEAGLATLNIPSMVKSHVALASYLVEDTFGSVGDIAKNVITHYHGAARKQVRSHAPPMSPPVSIHSGSSVLASFKRAPVMVVICSGGAYHGELRKKIVDRLFEARFFRREYV